THRTWPDECLSYQPVNLLHARLSFWTVDGHDCVSGVLLSLLLDLSRLRPWCSREPLNSSEVRHSVVREAFDNFPDFFGGGVLIVHDGCLLCVCTEKKSGPPEVCPQVSRELDCLVVS